MWDRILFIPCCAHFKLSLPEMGQTEKKMSHTVSAISTSLRFYSHNRGFVRMYKMLKKIILWGTWMCVENSMEIHPIVAPFHTKPKHVKLLVVLDDKKQVFGGTSNNCVALNCYYNILVTDLLMTPQHKVSSLSRAEIITRAFGVWKWKTLTQNKLFQTLPFLSPFLSLSGLLPSFFSLSFLYCSYQNRTSVWFRSNLSDPRSLEI